MGSSLLIRRIHIKNKLMDTSGLKINFAFFNKKIEQESPDFSQERNALFLFFCQLLGVLVPDILFYNLLAHVSQGAHVVAVAP